MEIRDDLLVSARVLVGQSVFEQATISIRDGWLTVEFEAEDCEEIAIPLDQLGGPDRG